MSAKFPRGEQDPFLARSLYVMGMASVCSKVVFLLLLIHWLFVLSLFVGVCYWSSICYALLSGLLQTSGRGKNSWLLYFNGLLSVDSIWCCASLPHGVVGWAASSYCFPSFISSVISQFPYRVRRQKHYQGRKQ